MKNDKKSHYDSKRKIGQDGQSYTGSWKPASTGVSEKYTPKKKSMKYK